MKYTKILPVITIEEFIKKAKLVSKFTSSTGKRYKVLEVENNVMYFLRLDAKSDQEWDLDLLKVYQAYSELDDFSTISFKPYVNRRHSPARGLLLHLRMIQ